MGIRGYRVSSSWQQLPPLPLLNVGFQTGSYGSQRRTEYQTSTMSNHSHGKIQEAKPIISKVCLFFSSILYKSTEWHLFPLVTCLCFSIIKCCQCFDLFSKCHRLASHLLCILAKDRTQAPTGDNITLPWIASTSSFGRHLRPVPRIEFRIIDRRLIYVINLLSPVWYHIVVVFPDHDDAHKL